MKKAVHYISLCGFTIQFKFEFTDNPYFTYQKRMQDSIMFWYSYCVVKPCRNPDLICEFIHHPSFILYPLGQNKYETLAYEKQKNRLIFSYGVQEYIIFSIIRNEILRLMGNHGFVLHCSAVEYKREVYIFLAPSGGGKSTIASLLHSKEIRKYSDDSCIIRKQREGFRVYQAPIEEKNRILPRKYGFPIKGIYFIKKSKKNRIQLIDGLGECQKFIKQIWVLYEKSIPLRELYIPFINKNTWYSCEFTKGKKIKEEFMNR